MRHGDACLPDVQASIPCMWLELLEGPSFMADTSLGTGPEGQIWQMFRLCQNLKQTSRGYAGQQALCLGHTHCVPPQAQLQTIPSPVRAMISESGSLYLSLIT